MLLSAPALAAHGPVWWIARWVSEGAWAVVRVKPLDQRARRCLMDAGAKLSKENVREHVNRAAAMLDQMLSSIMREMFVDQAAAFVTEEKPELDQCQVRSTHC